MHISFVLGRHWLISIYSDRDLSISSNTDVHFILQNDSCFMLRIRMRKSSVQHCCTMTQRLLQLSYIAGPNMLPYWSRCTQICQVLARENWNKKEDVAKCSETPTYFNVTVCKPRDRSYPWRTAPGFNFASNNQLTTFTHQ